MSTSNGEQGTVISTKWPHDQLTHHLAVHTPVQVSFSKTYTLIIPRFLKAHRNVDGAPTEFSAPAAQGFPQQSAASFVNYPQELIRQLSYTGGHKVTSPPVVVSAFGATSPIAFNNNNTTKLDLPIPDNEIVEQPNNNSQLTLVKNVLI
jgi:hypothetical protein